MAAFMYFFFNYQKQVQIPSQIWVFIEDKLEQTTECLYLLCPLSPGDGNRLDYSQSEKVPNIREFFGLVKKQNPVQFFFFLSLDQLQLTFPIYPSKEPQPQGNEIEVKYSES